MSCKNSTIDYISPAQVRWNTKRLINSNTGIFSRSWVEKKKKKTPTWKDWIRISYFICSVKKKYAWVSRKNVMNKNDRQSKLKIL